MNTPRITSYLFILVLTAFVGTAPVFAQNRALQNPEKRLADIPKMVEARMGVKKGEKVSVEKQVDVRNEVDRLKKNIEKAKALKEAAREAGDYHNMQLYSNYVDNHEVVVSELKTYAEWEGINLLNVLSPTAGGGSE